MYDNAISSYIIFNNLTIFNNSQGGIEIASARSYMVLNIKLSKFLQNNNGALVFSGIGNNKILNFKENLFVRNEGTHDSQGAALYIKAGGSTTISLYHCSFDHNIAFGSIVYISGHDLSFALGFDVVVSVNSSRFLNNHLGSALYASQLMLIFQDFIMFQNNSAETGAAMYIDQNTLITVADESLIQLVNNTALRGGAIYLDLSNCFNKGLLFSNFSNYTSVTFIDNIATVSGNSIYLNIPTSCNVVRNHTKNDSVAYIPYKLKYIQSHNIIGPAIATSPYRINLCSSRKCSFTDKKCLLTEKKMLGQSINFNATVCGYFNAIAETVQFQIKCINCGIKYRILNNEMLVNNRLPNKIKILTIDAHDDIVNDTNITLELSSVLSNNYHAFSARFSLTLSTCHSGFLFSAVSQKCECYSNAKQKHLAWV